MTTAPAVRLKGVSKSFPSSGGSSIVLEDIDLSIESGQKVSLIGPSGSGKSTLLSLIAGLLRPDTGSVEIDGVSMSDLSDAERAELRSQRIGIALQSENLIPFLSVLENVELAMSFANERPKAGRAQELLERMGVAQCATHYPRQISGGEAQRVALAVALVNHPAILLADEMVAQLDTATANTVVQDVFDSDMAVLFVTHNTELAERADLRLSLHNRQVVKR